MTENSLPKVSVILPSLNVSGYIKETLDSVMNQSMSDLEIICVDAGSTDGTLDIINAAIKSDPRIRLIMSDIRSYGYQVNLGIDESRGEYIAILETDDYVEPTMYSKLYEIAKSEKADYVKADYDAFFTQEDGTYYFFPRHTFGDKSLYGKAVNPKDHVNIGMNDWYLWQGLYSKEFIVTNNIRFSQTPGAAFQDIGFLFWTGLYAERAVYINDILYHYRIDRDGASSNLGKGLKFSYAEFTNIKRIMGDLRQYDLQSKKLLFARMIKSFVSSYSHISEDEQSRSERREAYEWFCGEIRNAYNEGIIDDSIILSGHIERLKLLLESEESYFIKYSTKDLNRFVEEKEIFAIFGCGDFGYKAYNYLKRHNKKIARYFDNNEALWGKTINSIPIECPAQIRKIEKETVFIIANEVYFADIKKQLLNFGISEDRILIFR